jgi:hypothetical protein
VKSSLQGRRLAGGVALAGVVLAVVACSTIHISTPFFSTVPDSILPTATDEAFLGRVQPACATIDSDTIALVKREVARVGEAMREQDEDRYWAAGELITALPASLRDGVVAALIETDEGYRSPYVSAKACGECHPKHFDEWSVSPHAYAQLSPVFNAMHGTLVSVTNGTLGDFCIRCHTPVGMNLGEPAFMENAKRNIASREGVTCVVCHRVAHDYGKISGRLAFEEGSIFDPVYGPSGGAILEGRIEEGGLQTRADAAPGQKVHGAVQELSEISKPGFCGMCHDVTLNNAFRLEEAFSEFKASPSGLRGETCQDCHMGKVPGQAKGYDLGPAAVVGGKPTKARKITNHMSAGPDHSIVHPGLFPHLPQEFGNPDRLDLRPFFAELAPGRYKRDASGTRLVPIPLWLDFAHRGGWGEEAFEEALTERLEGITDLAYELEDAEDPRAVRKKLEAARAALPDFKSWGGKPKDVAQLVAWIEDDRFAADREQRERARKILVTRQYRLLAEYRRQQLEVLRAGYKVHGIEVERADSEGIAFEVIVANGTQGHNVPTGFIAERTVFLQVHVTDRAGKTVFVSGDLDPNGDVRDRHSIYVHQGARGSKEPLWEFPTKPFPLGPKVQRDPNLFSLQSKFLTRSIRGGERERILPANYSFDPLPFLRPPTSSRVLSGRPARSRIHRVGIEPKGTRRARYAVSADQLAGHPGPHQITVRLVCGMVPVNLIHVIAGVGFDYGLSPRDVAREVVNGFSARIPDAPTRIAPTGLPAVERTTPLTKEPVKLSGRQILWELRLVLDDERRVVRTIPALEAK